MTRTKPTQPTLQVQGSSNNDNVFMIDGVQIQRIGRQVRQAALDNGILRVAAANARTTMTSFLRGLGFDQPEFW